MDALPRVYEVYGQFENGEEHTHTIQTRWNPNQENVDFDDEMKRCASAEATILAPGNKKKGQFIPATVSEVTVTV